MEKNEELNKSIDSLIDELFCEPSEGEQVQKGSDAVHEIIGEPKRVKEEKDPNKNSPKTADEGIKGADEGEEDEKAGKKRGRPNDLSQVSMRDASGASKGSYDASITEPAKSVPNETTVAKAKIEVSPEDYEILQKAKAEAEKAKEEESLKKARDERETLVKAAVEEATKGLKEENSQLRKSVDEMTNLLKSIAKKPAPRKSISSIQVLEKSFSGPEGNGQETFSKSEMLDVAEELAKAKKIPMECVIELEDTGFIYNPAHRSVLEAALRKRG